MTLIICFFLRVIAVGGGINVLRNYKLMIPGYAMPDYFLYFRQIFGDLHHILAVQ